jgi:hypothetical protein
MSWTLRTAAWLMILLACSSAPACPMCKDSIPNSDAQAAANVGVGINNSVYFMLGGFFAVLGVVSGVVVKGVRDANNRHRRGFPI